MSFKRKRGFLAGVRKELSDFIKKGELRRGAKVAINTARAKEGMREWAEEWGRKEPRWTSIYYLDSSLPLKLMQGYYRRFGFATRVRRGEGKSKRYYLDIYGWNSWINRSHEMPKKLPKEAEKLKLRQIA